MTAQENEALIRTAVMTMVETFAITFFDRHEREVDDDYGVINMKIHNVFISALGSEVQYYTSLVRSLDSSLGNALEVLAVILARHSFTVSDRVEGHLSPRQTGEIAALLERYKRERNVPQVADYQMWRERPGEEEIIPKTHISDYYLYDARENVHYLIELKLSGDLDNKKARSEKEALLEQFAILSNSLPDGADIRLRFATAYNRFGEGKAWNQGRVKQFFAADELLIGRDFWNFICQREDGYDIVIDEMGKNSLVLNWVEVSRQFFARCTKIRRYE